jgi:hypothetical protein
MDMLSKNLIDSICWINLGILAIFGGLFIVSKHSKFFISSFDIVALGVTTAVSIPIIFFGIKRFTRYRVYFKTNSETRKLAYAELVPNILSFVLLFTGITLIFLQSPVLYSFLMILTGCALELLAVKFYHDFIPKQVTDQPTADASKTG